ncbi:transport and Golgi organization protein 1 homolog [Sorex fumeus]|uniref:transport and Golgi organization protein 1 homolog n=1 Tax=Sorex fumeus TaxID=62283 RepID=UPI0024AE3B6E|nr:transport and Golgi organization protein 1 homolog [Sorex fumeus]
MISNEAAMYRDNINRFDWKNNHLNSMLQNAHVVLESQRAMNVKNQDLSEVNAGTERSEWNDLRSRKHNQEEMKRKLEESCSRLRSLQKNKKVELRQLKNKNYFLLTLYQQKNAKIEKKLKRKQQERVKLESQLCTSKDLLESLEDEIKKYKQQAEEIQNQLSQADSTFQKQIKSGERKLELAERVMEDTYMRLRSIH